MTTACLIIGYIGYTSVTADQIAAATPAGWDNLFFGWNLNINWDGIIPAINDKIASDGYRTTSDH